MSLYSNLTSSLKRKLVYAHTSIFLMIAIGTIGFRYFENLSWLESLYFTTATVTTVGYGDIVPYTQAGKLFTTFFVLFGVGTVLYALSILAQAFIQTEVIAALGVRRKSREMEKLSDHYIVCGAGRVGRRIISSLSKEKIPFVVIEFDKAKIEIVENADKYFILHADATDETNLRNAGVKRAAGLVTCLSDDAKNVYVVLTARNLNKNLHIVSRAVEEQAEPKLIQAGANRVVSPTIIGSLSMTRALIRPAIADFMDSIVAENLDLVFEEIRISRNSKYVGHALRFTNISSELNLLVVATRSEDGEMLFQPSGDTVIKEGDLLIVIGKADMVQKLNQMNQ